jgi:predicted HicB family RNase H-like nuclease
VADLESVEFRTMGLRLKPHDHARAAAMAKALGLSRSKWILQCVNAGLRAKPELRGGVTKP